MAVYQSIEFIYTASAQATLDIPLPAEYSAFEMRCQNFEPATSDPLALRVSYDGSTFKSGASDYNHEVLYAVSGTVAQFNGTGTNLTNLTPFTPASTTALKGKSKIEINPGDAATYPHFCWEAGGYHSGVASQQVLLGSGHCPTLGRIQKIRMLTGSGFNFSGIFILRGIGAA
jgi:hypothetical protein